MPNPFFGGVVFPGIVLGFLYMLPVIDRALFTRDSDKHQLGRARVTTPDRE